jgi:peptidoglycan/xylan/chitin deacetylase (PgdA/CDA1 family)
VALQTHDTVEPLQALGTAEGSGTPQKTLMLRYLLAPVHPPFARSLGLPRTLAELASATRPGAPGVAITFDDGPHPEGTPAILEVLARHDAVATFFVIGEQVIKRPGLLAQIQGAGHAIALHGYHHRLHLRRSVTELEDDFTRGIAAIQDAAGAPPRYHRPPFGIYSAASLRIARDRGLQPLLWDRWGKDWRKFTTPERIATRAVGGIQAADVILLHDADFYSAKRSHERTAAALELVLARLKSAGIGTFLCG